MNKSDDVNQHFAVVFNDFRLNSSMSDVDNPIIDDMQNTIY